MESKKRAILLALVCIVISASFSHAQDDSSLMAYFPIQNNFLDESGNLVSADLTGMSFGPDRNGAPNEAVVFSGNGYITLDQPLLQFGPMTVSMWINGSSGYIACNGGESGAYHGFYLLARDGELTFGTRGTDGLGGYASVAWPSGWNHIVATYDGTYDNGCSKIYINGELAATGGPASSNAAEPINNLRLGMASLPGIHNDRFNGSMDELRFYDRELTPGEVAQLYWGRDPSLVAFFPVQNSFQDESGNLVSADLTGMSFGPDRNGAPNEAVVFSGNGYITLDQPLLQFGPMTVSMWINGSSGYIACNGGESGAYHGFYLLAGDGELTFVTRGTDGLGGYASVVWPSGWNHIVATYDGTYDDGCSKIYINGELAATGGPASSNAAEPINNLRLGMASLPGIHNDRFNGSMDELRFYDRELTPGEVAQLYSSRDLTVQIAPQVFPVVIPETGGGFFYDVVVQNSMDVAIIADIGIQAVLPDGTIYTVDFKEGIEFPAGATIVRNGLVQTVPAGAPAGQYIYRLSVGNYFSSDLIDSDEFSFEKLGSRLSLKCSGDWTLSGWDGRLPAPEVPGPTVNLFDATPNPFNPKTTIRFDLPEPSKVTLQVYDISGRLVRVLRNGIIEDAGRHEAVWNGQDDSGRAVASGLYFYHLQAGNYIETKRMTLLK